MIMITTNIIIVIIFILSSSSAGVREEYNENKELVMFVISRPIYLRLT